MVKLVEHVPAKRVGWIRCPVGSYRWLKIGTCGLSSLVLGVTGARGGGTSAPPKVFIWWKSWQNYLKSEQNPKFLQNPGRDLKSEQTPWIYEQKWRQLWFETTCAQRHMQSFFCIFWRSLFRVFFGKVRESSSKNPSHPNNLPAPTCMLGVDGRVQWNSPRAVPPLICHQCSITAKRAAWPTA